jgi:hypothetical protein
MGFDFKLAYQAERIFDLHRYFLPLQKRERENCEKDVLKSHRRHLREKGIGRSANAEQVIRVRCRRPPVRQLQFDRYAPVRLQSPFVEFVGWLIVALPGEAIFENCSRLTLVQLSWAS